MRLIYQLIGKNRCNTVRHGTA